MTVASWLLVVLVTLIAWRVYSNNLIQATSEDWFVVFDVDAEMKTLTLWFCPIIAFHISGGMTIPITSKPSFTSKLKMSRPAKKVNDDFWSVSCSYGKWVRDNSLIDEDGTPEMLSQDSTFSDIIENYLIGDFKLNLATTVPRKYRQFIAEATIRASKETMPDAP